MRCSARGRGSSAKDHPKSGPGTDELVLEYVPFTRIVSPLCSTLLTVCGGSPRWRRGRSTHHRHSIHWVASPDVLSQNGYGLYFFLKRVTSVEERGDSFAFQAQPIHCRSLVPAKRPWWVRLHGQEGSDPKWLHPVQGAAQKRSAKRPMVVPPEVPNAPVLRR